MFHKIKLYQDLFKNCSRALNFGHCYDVIRAWGFKRIFFLNLWKNFQHQIFFFSFFWVFLWSAFENLDLVQNWLGSSSSTNNVTLRGGICFGTIDHVVPCTLNLYTSTQLDLEIKKSATFSKFFCFCLGLSWHKFQEKFPTSNKLTLWRIAHSNSTNAALLVSDVPGRRPNGQDFHSPHTHDLTNDVIIHGQIMVPTK
jgi:hypothetical protein